jgi:hypothetical protein
MSMLDIEQIVIIASICYVVLALESRGMVRG